MARGSYFWFGYAAYFATTATWSVWGGVAAFLVVSFLMVIVHDVSRAFYGADRSDFGWTPLDFFMLAAVLLTLGLLPVAAWRAHSNGQLVWFLVLIPAVLVAASLSVLPLGLAIASSIIRPNCSQK